MFRKSVQKECSERVFRKNVQKECSERVFRNQNFCYCESRDDKLVNLIPVRYPVVVIPCVDNFSWGYFKHLFSNLKVHKWDFKIKCSLTIICTKVPTSDFLGLNILNWFFYLTSSEFSLLILPLSWLGSFDKNTSMIFKKFSNTPFFCYWNWAKTVRNMDALWSDLTNYIKISENRL